MATLQATKVLEALRKAKRVGRVEGGVVIDGCELVMQNLSPEDYDAINQDTDELEEMEFLHAYQIGHICRAIVEIEGQDLRNTDFIEDTVPSGAWAVAAYVTSKDAAEKFAGEISKAGGKATVLPPDGDETRTIKLERHEWLRDNLLASWGREAIVVAWRKFAELLTEADEKAKEGIQFKIPDESPEERFRRLLGEIKEVQEDLPNELVTGILGDAGFMSKSSAEELEAVNQRMKDLAKAAETPQQPPAAPQAPQPAPVAPTTPEPQQAPQQAPEPQQQAPAVSPAELMRQRQPVSKQVGHIPVPRAEAAAPAPATRAAVPEQLRRAAEANAASVGRSAKIAALEAQVDPTLAVPAEEATPRRPEAAEVAELAQKKTTVDGAALKDIIDRPPPVGINPRFKPPGT